MEVGLRFHDQQQEEQILDHLSTNLNDRHLIESRLIRQTKLMYENPVDDLSVPQKARCRKQHLAKDELAQLRALNFYMQAEAIFLFDEILA